MTQITMFRTALTICRRPNLTRAYHGLFSFPATVAGQIADGGGAGLGASVGCIRSNPAIFEPHLTHSSCSWYSYSSHCISTSGLSLASRIPVTQRAASISLRSGPRLLFLHQNSSPRRRRLFTMASTKEFRLLCLENPLLGR